MTLFSLGRRTFTCHHPCYRFWPGSFPACSAARLNPSWSAWGSSQLNCQILVMSWIILPVWWNLANETWYFWSAKSLPSSQQPTMYEGSTEFRANLSLLTDIHGPFQTRLKHVFLSFLFLNLLQLRNASNEPLLPIIHNMHRKVRKGKNKKTPQTHHTPGTGRAFCLFLNPKPPCHPSTQLLPPSVYGSTQAH
jgi:hypothetical protein